MAYLGHHLVPRSHRVGNNGQLLGSGHLHGGGGAKRTRCVVSVAEGEDSMILVIDDLKSFDFGEQEVIYARNSEAGFAELQRLAQLSLIDSPVDGIDLWLDHDLGGEDTIRPICLMLAEMAYYGSPYPVEKIVICSMNAVGVEWIYSTLNPYYPVYHALGGFGLPSPLLRYNG